MKRPSFAWASPILTKVGRSFGFDAHYIARSSALVSMSYAISAAKGLITGYLVTRLFPPAMYGEYKFVLGILGTIGFIGLPGLPTSLATAIARKEPVSLARLGRWMSLIAGIGSLAILGCIPFLWYWGRMELWPLFFIAALVFIPNTVSTNLFSGIIRGASAFGASFRANLTTNTIIILAVLAMLLIKPSSLLLLTFTSAIPAIIYTLTLIPYERKYRSKESQKPILMRAAGLSVATIPASASWYIDGLLISAFFGLNQLALFSVALLIPEQVKVWTKELFPIIFAKQASGKDTRDRRRKMHQAVIAGTCIFAIGIVCYMLITPYIIPLIFPRYPAAELIPLTNIAAITLITAPSTLYLQFLEARGMVRAVHWSNWIASAVFVVGLVTLIPTYGPLGAVLARGFFRMTLVVVPFVIVQRMPMER